MNEQVSWTSMLSSNGHTQSSTPFVLQVFSSFWWCFIAFHYESSASLVKYIPSHLFILVLLSGESLLSLFFELLIVGL